METKIVNLQPIRQIATKQKHNPKIPIDPKLYVSLVEGFSIEKKLKDIFYRNQKIGSAPSEYVLGDHPKNTDVDLTNLLMQHQIHYSSAHMFWHSWAMPRVKKGILIDKVAKFMGDTVKTVRENYEHLLPDYLTDIF